MLTSELIDTLKAQAIEIALDGHAGWGNTMAEAAEALRKYEAAIDAIYNHDEAARAAVIKHFESWHLF